MDKIQKQILENQLLIMEKLNLTDRQSYNETLNLVYSKINLKEEPCCEMPERIITEEEKEELYNNGKSLFANSGRGEKDGN